MQLIRRQNHEPQGTSGQSDLAAGGPRMCYAHTTVHSLKVCSKERSFLHEADEFTGTQTDAYRFRNEIVLSHHYPHPDAFQLRSETEGWEGC